MWVTAVWDGGERRANSSKALGTGKLPVLASPRFPSETWKHKRSELRGVSSPRGHRPNSSQVTEDGHRLKQPDVPHGRPEA